MRALQRPYRPELKRKALTVRTTINKCVDRRGGARDDHDLKALSERARKLLADTSAMLELELERLFDEEIDLEDRVRLKEVSEGIRQTQKVLTMVLEIEARTGLSSLDESSALNLDEARDEILRRLARLAL